MYRIEGFQKLGFVEGEMERIWTMKWKLGVYRVCTYRVEGF